MLNINLPYEHTVRDLPKRNENMYLSTQRLVYEYSQ